MGGNIFTRAGKNKLKKRERGCRKLVERLFFIFLAVFAAGLIFLLFVPCFLEAELAFARGHLHLLLAVKLGKRKIYFRRYLLEDTDREEEKSRGSFHFIPEFASLFFSFFQTVKKHGFAGGIITSLRQDFLRCIWEKIRPFLQFCRGMRLAELHWQVQYGWGDPALTGFSYGILWALISAFSTLFVNYTGGYFPSSAFHDKMSVTIEPVFDRRVFSFSVRCIFRLRLVHIITGIVKMTVRRLREKGWGGKKVCRSSIPLRD